MHKFIKTFKIILASALMTLMLSSQASSLSGHKFIGTEIIETVVAGANNLDKAVRGFRGASRSRGFGMNFGGQGKNNASPANNNLNKNNAANNQNASKNNINANKPRSGFWGFLAGMGIFSWLLMGGALLGGGFLIYLLAMLLIPMVMGFMAQRKKASVEDELPTSRYTSEELFGSKENQDDKDRFKKGF